MAPGCLFSRDGCFRPRSGPELQPTIERLLESPFGFIGGQLVLAEFLEEVVFVHSRIGLFAVPGALFTVSAEGSPILEVPDVSSAEQAVAVARHGSSWLCGGLGVLFDETIERFFAVPNYVPKSKELRPDALLAPAAKGGARNANVLRGFLL
ncbi:MAG TPA: hypothetical protein VMI94_12610 [Bryobacteraceae bacterium]|nr:hypothetical protein [Bryobacteraceae bacterium]